jgi:hypothetical protein
MPLLMFAFQSGVLAALFPVVLWFSRGDTRLVVWRLSLLLCSYFWSAACVLSAAAATAKALLFLVVFNVAQAAFFVDAELNQIAGMMIIYLVPVVMAGVFGHALAEHRESAGTEKAAAAAAEKTLAGAKGKVAHVPESARTVVFTIVGMAFFLGCVIASMEWWGTCLDHSVCTAAEFGPGGSLFCTISLSLSFGIFMMHPLTEAILGIDGGVFFCFWCLALVAVGGISSLLLGWVGWTVTLWTVLLGTTAFFGYCVRVYDSYVKIIRYVTKPNYFFFRNNICQEK